LPDQVEIALNPARVKVLTAAASLLICCLGLGFAALLVVLPVVGRAQRIPVFGWIMIVFWALVLLGVGVPSVAVLPRSLRDRTLVINTDGIALTGSRSWAVCWEEIQQVMIGADRAMGLGSLGRWPRTYRLLVVPAGSDFAVRHPELVRRQRREGLVGLPVITMDRRIREAIDHALSTHGGSRYGGVVDGWRPPNPRS
jgi:hypothetical protein